MCGIAGIISSKRNLSIITEQMKKDLFHRGPDNQTSFISKNLGLVHTRLSIIDLSEAANQPMTHFSGEYVIVFNGEIFNYRELREKLKMKGIPFSTDGDTEVLLNGFVEYGKDFLMEVRGFFAFCLYNIKEEKIILSRDFFGKKPLYYYKKDNEFLFGSEIKAIKNNIENSIYVNYESISHYLWKGYYANGETAFENIESMLP